MGGGKCLTISGIADFGDNSTLRLYNIVGETMMTHRLPEGKRCEQIPCDIESGVYIVEISQGTTPVYKGKIMVR